jgi:hypothetical protein
MTVRLGSGDAVGDAGDDLATPTPVTARRRLCDETTPEHPLGGRFWVLSQSDDEDEDDVAMDAASPFPDAGSLRYLCRTPEEVGDRDLSESIQDMARRSIKRLHRRQMQRKAAMEFMAMEGTSSSQVSMPLGRSGSTKSVNLPVIPPSVFNDDGQGVGPSSAGDVGCRRPTRKRPIRYLFRDVRVVQNCLAWAH